MHGNDGNHWPDTGRPGTCNTWNASTVFLDLYEIQPLGKDPHMQIFCKQNMVIVWRMNSRSLGSETFIIPDKYRFQLRTEEQRDSEMVRSESEVEIW